MTMTAEQGAPSRGKARKGSAQSDRQVAFAVKDGKAVTASLFPGREIRGFVIGADDFHWSVVDEDGRVHLVHKSSPALSIDAEPSIDQANAQIRDMVEDFRAYIIREHFNRTPSRQKD